MSILDVQISLSAGGVCVPDVPIDHGWTRLAEGKWVKREWGQCIVWCRRFLRTAGNDSARRKCQRKTLLFPLSLILSFLLFSPSFVLLFRKYGLNEIHWLALVWSSLPRQQLSGWGAQGQPRWEPKCIKHNPEQIMCKRKQLQNKPRPELCGVDQWVCIQIGLASYTSLLAVMFVYEAKN